GPESGRRGDGGGPAGVPGPADRQAETAQGDPVRGLAAAHAGGEGEPEGIAVSALSTAITPPTTAATAAMATADPPLRWMPKRPATTPPRTRAATPKAGASAARTSAVP